MLDLHPIVTESVRRAVENQKGKKRIGYDKLLPYATNTLRFLVKRAKPGQEPSYQELSEAIEAGNAQNANRGFAAVNLMLDGLALLPKFSNPRPPDITTIVHQSGKPTAGTGVFYHSKLQNESDAVQKKWLFAERQRVLDFKQWDEILAFLGIVPMPNLLPPNAQLFGFERSSTEQGGKSPEHQLLQDLIEKQPAIVGLALKAITSSVQEFVLWSLDRIDVILKTNDEWVAVEVKPSFAPQEDLIKGVFQVVKYDALLKATVLAQGLPQSTRAVLALGGVLPPTVRELAKRLRIEVFENLSERLSRGFAA